MDRNDRHALIILAMGAASALLVWAIISGAFEGPGNYGWVYNYQTLIGGGLALLGAILTIRILRRDQMLQRYRFNKQMVLANRPDRLRVARETGHIVPRLRDSLAAVRQLPEVLCKAPTVGMLSKGSWLQTTVKDLRNALDDKFFANLLSLLDDQFTELRGRLESNTQKILNRIPTAFSKQGEGMIGGVPLDDWLELSHEETLRILQSNSWLSFPDWERDLDDLIEYFQRLRLDYDLPRLGRRHNEWGPDVEGSAS